jgi:hypothetical protein
METSNTCELEFYVKGKKCAGQVTRIVHFDDYSYARSCSRECEDKIIAAKQAGIRDRVALVASKKISLFSKIFYSFLTTLQNRSLKK